MGKTFWTDRPEEEPLALRPGGWGTRLETSDKANIEGET